MSWFKKAFKAVGKGLSFAQKFSPSHMLLNAVGKRVGGTAGNILKNPFLR